MTDSEDKTPRPHHNLFSQTSDFIDRNIRVIKYCSVYGLAGVGVVLILRSTYALRKFRSVKDVPANFIKLHARLHGDVVGVTETGRILVNHAPVVTLGRLGASEGRLPITLAGTELNHLAFPWLEKNILNKHIWFTILRISTETPNSVTTNPTLLPKLDNETEPKEKSPTDQTTGVSDKLKDISGLKYDKGEADINRNSKITEDSKTTPVEKSLVKLDPEEVLECIVTAKKGFLRNMVVNEEVIRLGLATVSHIDGLEGDRAVTKLMTRLVRAEVKAEKKGLGIWTRPTLMERIRNYPTDTKNRIINFFRSKLSWKSKKDDGDS